MRRASHLVLILLSMLSFLMLDDGDDELPHHRLRPEPIAMEVHR